MKISSAFPSKYLSAADLDGRNIMATMAHVTMEKIGDDEKPVLYFDGKEKGLALNKTNAKNIAVTYGDDTNDWHGQQIVLFPAMVEYQGNTVEAIRVRAPQPKDRKATEAPQRRGSMSEAGADNDAPF